nr:T9SS type A sorting domain-containing protein [Bacteroidota bacterium]
PFKSGTTIEFTLAKPSDVMLKIYDADGRDIKTLINAHVSAGIHTTTWNGKDELNRKVAGGVYYYQLSCDTFSTTKQLILLGD